jgi:hypothetical protein
MNIRRPQQSAILALVLVFASADYATASVHGVRQLQVVPADGPPVFDLEQVQGVVSGAIDRSERNLKIQVAILRIDPLRPPQDDCGVESPAPFGFATVQLLCMPLAAITNALERAIRRDQIRETVDEIRQAHTESDPTLAPDLAADVDSLLSSNLLQLQLAVSAADYISKNTAIELLNDSTSDAAEYRFVTHLERVEAVDSPVDSKVSIRLYGDAALVRAADGSIIDSYRYSTETPEYFVEGWSQGGIGQLATSVSKATARLAEVLAEEVLLSVNSPRLRRKGYLLEPVSPPNKRCLIGCGINALANYGFYATGSLRPIFEWQDFREVYAREPLYANTDASQLEVVYDVRIYATRRVDTVSTIPGAIETSSASFLFGGELLHEFREIIGTRFMPEVTFEACERYLWTVRSRFTVDGKTHVTHWSGNYDEKDIEEYRQNLISTSAGARRLRGIAGYLGFDQREYYREESYYFPFQASEPGQDCSSED